MSISDNYPPMDPDSCTSIGMGGGCGSDCSVFLRGECDVGHEVLESINNDPLNMTVEEIDELNDMYQYVHKPRKVIPIIPVRGKYDNYDRAMKGIVL